LYLLFTDFYPGTDFPELSADGKILAAWLNCHSAIIAALLTELRCNNDESFTEMAITPIKDSNVWLATGLCDLDMQPGDSGGEVRQWVLVLQCRFIIAA